MKCFNQLKMVGAITILALTTVACGGGSTIPTRANSTPTNNSPNIGNDIIDDSPSPSIGDDVTTDIGSDIPADNSLADAFERLEALEASNKDLSHKARDANKEAELALILGGAAAALLALANGGDAIANVKAAEGTGDKVKGFMKGLFLGDRSDADKKMAGEVADAKVTASEIRTEPKIQEAKNAAGVAANAAGMAAMVGANAKASADKAGITAVKALATGEDAKQIVSAHNEAIGEMKTDITKVATRLGESTKEINERVSTHQSNTRLVQERHAEVINKVRGEVAEAKTKAQAALVSADTVLNKYLNPAAAQPTPVVSKSEKGTNKEPSFEFEPYPGYISGSTSTATPFRGVPFSAE